MTRDQLRLADYLAHIVEASEGGVSPACLWHWGGSFMGD